MITKFKLFEMTEEEYYKPGSYFLTLYNKHFCKSQIINYFWHGGDNWVKLILLDDNDNIQYGTFYTAYLQRRLTPEEIEEFELKKSAKNYNL